MIRTSRSGCVWVGSDMRGQEGAATGGSGEGRGGDSSYPVKGADPWVSGKREGGRSVEAQMVNDIAGLFLVFARGHIVLIRTALPTTSWKEREGEGEGGRESYANIDMTSSV